MFFWLADEPETAYYLSQEEKDLMVTRKRRQIGHTTSSDQMHKADVIKAFKDWKVWMFAFVSVLLLETGSRSVSCFHREISSWLQLCGYIFQLLTTESGSIRR